MFLQLFGQALLVCSVGFIVSVYLSTVRFVNQHKYALTMLTDE